MQEILLFVQAHTLPIVAGIVGLFLLIQLILQIKLVRKMSRMQKKIDTITDKVGEYLAVVMEPENESQEEKADADLKIFLTASAETRAKRRLLELEQKGINTSFAEVMKDISYRDEQDSSRAAAPLKAAEDAVVVDTTSLNFDESFALLCELVINTLAMDRKD